MTEKESETKRKPEILAPAGNRASFLAALAAGADAVYCGLKSYSARMEAKNFTLEELAALTRLAHDRGTRVYVTLNALLKPDDLDRVGKLIDRLQRYVKPDALIIQDLAVVELARQTGFSGEIHLSTLTNVNSSAAMALIDQIPRVRRVVLPRELNIDEVKTVSSACPPELALEIFIHGALCYAVSGRCYWSSYLGGKSGLRGRCVQPCRRMYSQKDQSRRFFSCQDLSLDVLAKVLLSIPQISAWKIEGRKKGPHYVYYTVKAYRILRDLSDLEKEPEKMSIAKKTALGLLAQALGRTGTHYNFLPQRPQKPINIARQTGSGLFVGKVQGPKHNTYVVPRMDLLPGDVLRLGYEDESWHAIQRIGKFVPKKGRFHFKLSSKRAPHKGTPVFLTDRREESLNEMITALDREIRNADNGDARIPASTFNMRLPEVRGKKKKVVTLSVYRRWDSGRNQGLVGLWLSPETAGKTPKRLFPQVWWWLPPVGWPAEEDEFKALLDGSLKKGGRRFVLNATWQRAFFKKDHGLELWAGPFCNLANPLAMQVVDGLGFSGAFVSPESGKKDFMALPHSSPLPLGIVVSGSWPLCISRTIADDIQDTLPFTSPRGEQAWVKKYGPDYWMFPNWKMDLREKKEALRRAGYSMFVHLIEPVPAAVKMKKRPGLWNWEVGLK